MSYKVKWHNVTFTGSNLLTSSQKLNKRVTLIEKIFKMAYVCTNQRIETRLEIGYISLFLYSNKAKIISIVKTCGCQVGHPCSSVLKPRKTRCFNNPTGKISHFKPGLYSPTLPYIHDKPFSAQSDDKVPKDVL